MRLCVYSKYVSHLLEQQGIVLLMVAALPGWEWVCHGEQVPSASVRAEAAFLIAFLSKIVCPVYQNTLAKTRYIDKALRERAGLLQASKVCLRCV